MKSPPPIFSTKNPKGAMLTVIRPLSVEKVFGLQDNSDNKIKKRNSLRIKMCVQGYKINTLKGEKFKYWRLCNIVSVKLKKPRLKKIIIIVINFKNFISHGKKNE